MLLKVTWGTQSLSGAVRPRLRLNAVCFWRPAIARFALRGQIPLSQQPSMKASESGRVFPPHFDCSTSCEQERSNCPFRVQSSKTHQLPRLFQFFDQMFRHLLAVQASNTSRPACESAYLTRNRQLMTLPSRLPQTVELPPACVSHTTIQVTPWNSLQYIGGMRLASSKKASPALYLCSDDTNPKMNGIGS